MKKPITLLLIMILMLPASQLVHGYLPRNYFPTGNQLAGLGLQTPGLYKGLTDQIYTPSPDDAETHAYMNLYPSNDVYVTVTFSDDTGETEMDVKAYEMKYVYTIQQVWSDYDIYDQNDYIIDQYPEQTGYGNGYLLSMSGTMPQTGGAYLNQLIIYTKGVYLVEIQGHVHMAPELSGEQLTAVQTQAFTELRNTVQSLAGIASGNLGDQDTGDTGDTGDTTDTGNTTTKEPPENTDKKTSTEIVQQLQNIAINTINQLKQKLNQQKQTTQPTMNQFPEPDPEPKQSNGQPVSQQAKQKADNRKQKMQQIGVGVEVNVVEVQTPSGVEVKVGPVTDPGMPSVSVDPKLVYKIKYQANKKIIDPLIDNLADKIAEKIPIISLYKDYFKADKDTNLFNNEEAIMKTSDDLKVSKKAATIYNDMSGIEDREKQMSPMKNAIPSTPATKPFEYVVQAMGTGIKKKVANGYRKEYEIAEQAATRYKDMGLSYSQIIENTIRDVEDETLFNANSQMLNVQSKGVYKNQKDRIGAYIIQMKDEGII